MMRKPFAWIVPVVGCAVAGAVIAQTSTPAPPGTPPGAPAGAPHSAPKPPPTVPANHMDAAPRSEVATTPAEQKKALYSLGVLLSRNLDSFALTPAEFNSVKQGFSDGYLHKADAKDAEAQIPQVQALERERVRSAGDAYAAKAAAAPGATRTASGMIFQQVKAGTGATPTTTDRVKVNYEGKLVDGTVFDSSAMHGGQPATFPVTGVIACWTEALQKMKVGGKAHLVCPASIAYGDRAVPPKIRAGSTLDFNVELVDILPPSPPPEAPGAHAPGVPGTPGAPGAPATPGAPASAPKPN